MATSVASLDGIVGKDADVERVFRKFTFKCLQIIVQSRIENSSSARVRDTSQDYFSIGMPDNIAVEEKIKQTLEGIKSYPVKDQSICVEIPLVTNDGEHMFLETWDLTFNLSSLDVSASKIQHIFTRMGLTLKSLLGATRATPAHKLARNQGDKGGGYVLNYRFYLGKPRTHMLGEDSKKTRAGALPTAFGLYTINVTFRTKLLLSPEMAASASSSMELTDNYFMKEYGHKVPGHSQHSDPQPCSPRLSKTSSFSSPDRHSDSPYCFAVSPSPRSSNEHLSTTPSKDPSNWPLSSILNLEELPEPAIGAFSKQRADPRPTQVHLPFEGLMKRSMMARLEQREKMETTLREEDAIEPGERLRGRHESSRRHAAEGDEKENVRVPGFRLSHGVEDDFVMVDKPPFALEEDPRDVKVFLGNIMRAPQDLYDTSQPVGTVNDYIDDVGMLMSRLEADMPVLDEFCQSVINFHSTEDDDGTLFS